MTSRATLVLPIVWVALGAGCDTFNEIGPATCDRSEGGNPPVLYTEGTVSDDGEIYKTSEFDEELLWFPGGMHYEIEHQLGAVPSYWQAYLSFEQFGTKEGSIAEATGNQAELIRIDDTSLVVANETCSDFWLVVIAGAGVSSSESAEP